MPDEDPNKRDSGLLGIIGNAFPGRGTETTAPIGLLYAGVRWGHDYRDNAVPRDAAGNVLFATDSQEDYHAYMEWLADYLPTISLQPTAEQEGLVKYALGMRPDDAMFFLGMHAGIYDAEISIGAVEVPLGAISDPECVASIEREQSERARQWNHLPFCPLDAGYRVVLGQVLRAVPTHEERRKLLDTFFALYHEYVRK